MYLMPILLLNMSFKRFCSVGDEMCVRTCVAKMTELATPHEAIHSCPKLVRCGVQRKSDGCDSFGQKNEPAWFI